jgi:N12 class adenine-specific DNA methylase
MPATRGQARPQATVKRLEGALARAEERIKRLTDSAKDPGITFEQTGIDYLFCDEAHGYKNLATVSNIPGAAVDGAQRASDLDMKLAYLRGRHGGRVATFATATPIANSVTEAYTMQRYLRPDLLQNAGLTDFDTWAATFGEVTTSLELAPDGSRFRMQARFAKFRNVPELLRMWHVSADIKTAEDLHLPTPALPPATLRRRRACGPGTDRVHGRLCRARQSQARARPKTTCSRSRPWRMAALDLRLLGRDPARTPSSRPPPSDRRDATPTPIAPTRRRRRDRCSSCSATSARQRSRNAGGLAGGWNAPTS